MVSEDWQKGSYNCVSTGCTCSIGANFVQWVIGCFLLVQNLTSGKVKTPSSILICAKAHIVFQSTRAKNGRWNRRIRVRYTRKVSAVKQCSLQLAMPHRNNCQNSGRVVSPPPCEKGAYEFLRHRIFCLSKGLSLSTLKAP